MGSENSWFNQPPEGWREVVKGKRCGAIYLQEVLDVHCYDQLVLAFCIRTAGKNKRINIGTCTTGHRRERKALMFHRAL